MQSENSTREEDLLPFGAPQADTVDPSVRAKLAQATSGNQKIQRSPRALRPLWYSIPILVIALAASAYLIGMTLWSRSSLAHWTNGEYLQLASSVGLLTTTWGPPWCVRTRSTMA